MHHDGIRVRHSALDQAAADMSSAVTALDQRLRRLESDLAPLRAEWHGQARAGFGTAKAAWDAATHDLRDLLDEAHRTVGRANAEYLAADRRGAARFAP